MATYNATVGHDVFFGTAAADTFNFLTDLGNVDYVYGNGGIDTLKVSYSDSTSLDFVYIRNAGSNAFSGEFQALSAIVFNGVEKLYLSLSNDNNYVFVDAAPLAIAGTALSLNGRAGVDLLSIDLSTFSDSTFQHNANGTVTSNRGSYSNFETYAITLGAGTNAVATAAGNDTVYASFGGANTISTGVGDDTIVTVDGINTIDGGTDLSTNFDTWTGTYTSASALTYIFDGYSRTGSITGGTTFAGIEKVSINAGSGNDTFAVAGALGSSAFLDGREGIDTLTIDNSAQTDKVDDGQINADSSGGFGGYVYNPGRNSTGFAHIENLKVTLGAAENQLIVDASPLATAGNTLVLDGGLNHDYLAIDFSGLTSTTFRDNGDGTVTSNHGSYSNFETYSVTLGIGKNSVTTGAGSDTVVANKGGTNSIDTGAGSNDIYTTDGTNTIKGGVNYDTWHGTYTTASALTIRFDGATRIGSVSGGTTFAGIEQAFINAGSGNDNFHVVGASDLIAVFDGRDGLDTLTIDQTGISGAQGRAHEIYSAGTDGFNGYVYVPDGRTVFYNIENLNFAFGDDNDFVVADASSSLSGATLFVDGGNGTDTLRVNGSASGYSIVQDGLGGYIITDTNPTDGNYGSFTATRFEAIQFTGTTVALTYYNAGSTYTGMSGADVLTGNAADDTLNGLDGDDALYGLGGVDILNGGNGNDLIDGGNGSDTVTYASAGTGVKVNLALTTGQATGGGGIDKILNVENLIGSGANDTLTGNNLNNRIEGLGGSDAINGGIGADRMFGGAGNDTYTVDNTGDVVSEETVGGIDDGGTDLIRSSVSYTLANFVEKLTLTGGNAINGTGNALANTITGNSGTNYLRGEDGKDTISAGAGNDWLYGGQGANALIGGLGADTFVFDLLETSANKDTIKDFEHGVDKLAFSRFAFGGYADYVRGPVAVENFTLGTASTTADHHFIYNRATGALFYDEDGVGGAAQVQVATFISKPILDAGDLVLL